MRNPVDPEVICHAHLNMGAQQRNAYAGVKSPCTYDLLLVHSADIHDASLSRSAPPLFRSVLFALAAFDWAGTFESPVERKRCVDCRQQEALQLPLVLGQLRSNSPGSLSSWGQVQVPSSVPGKRTDGSKGKACNYRASDAGGATAPPTFLPVISYKLWFMTGANY